jgi:hypothetical protein
MSFIGIAVSLCWWCVPAPPEVSGFVRVQGLAAAMQWGMKGRLEFVGTSVQQATSRLLYCQRRRE